MPTVAKSSIEDNEQRLGLPFQMFCNFNGRPSPKVEWYKEGKMIENSTQFTISGDMQFLNIKILRPEDYGNYECVGKNYVGLASRSIRLKRTSMIDANNNRKSKS